MRNFAKSLKLLGILFMIILFISGCSNPEKSKVEHFNKGMEYVKKQDWKSAIIELQNAIKIDPKYAEARYQLGLAYSKNGEPNKAVKELIRATDLNPKNSDAQLILARVFSTAKVTCYLSP